MGSRLFTVDELTVLKTIACSDICTQAQFIPDHPVILEVGQILELDNAEFHIDEKKIEGHWADLRTPKIKEEKKK